MYIFRPLRRSVPYWDALWVYILGPLYRSMSYRNILWVTLSDKYEKKTGHTLQTSLSCCLYIIKRPNGHIGMPFGYSSDPKSGKIRGKDVQNRRYWYAELDNTDIEIYPVLRKKITDEE